MLRTRNYVILFISLLAIFLSAGVSQIIFAQEKPQSAAKQSSPKPAGKEGKVPGPLFSIMPQEIKLGLVSLDRQGEGIITISSAKPGVVHWSTQGPEGWTKLQEQLLSGILEKEPGLVRVSIKMLDHELPSSPFHKDEQAVDVEMKFESGDSRLVCVKKVSIGTHRETIKFILDQEPITVYASFNLSYIQKSPGVNLIPLRLDLGSVLPDKTVTKKIILNNIGKETLNWSVAMPRRDDKNISGDLKRGRFLSFVDIEDTLESGFYTIPAHLKDNVKLTGKWMKVQGYPSCEKGENEIRVNFNGSGVILYLLRFPGKGNLTVSIDNQTLDKLELFEELGQNNGELLVAEGLEYGAHVLTITSRDTNMVFEGVKILGVSTAFLPPNSIKIFPNSGVVTRQTNYLTVSLNPRQLSPGYYADDLLFTTNGGQVVVEVFAEILSENVPKVIDVYRYYNGRDYFFTADPQADTQKLAQDRYIKEGIAFRLFKPDTPGTKVFYRWYNPQKKSYFYHYSETGGGNDLRGYVFEKAIGNIATSKLTNTRELYRWYNAKTGHYFYSIDPQGEKINKKAYRFDGIAGYVK
jgi:hypothetical protein